MSSVRYVHMPQNRSRFSFAAAVPRAIMRLTSRVVQMCFANADKYNLDFSHITAEGRSNSETDGSNPGSFGGSGNTSDS